MLGQNLDRKLVVSLALLLIVGLAGIIPAVSLAKTSLIADGGSGAAAGITGDVPIQSYVPHWDDNPVAYIPEAAVIKQRGYPHNWDENPLAYIPEAEPIRHPNRYLQNWDDNPSAYIPEADFIR